MRSELPPWLERPFARLERALEAGRLAHALLVHGPAGWGEQLLADAIALRVVGAGPEVESAMGCAHPDLRWLAPEKPGSQIKVDDVRLLGDFVARTPAGGASKVAVIVDAEAMNIAAANALLKTLEEPPAGTHLVLTSTRPAGLPPTVRSRCQQVAIPVQNAAQTAAWLGERTAGVESSRLGALLFEYANAPLHVLDALARDELGLSAALTKALDAGSPVVAVSDALAKDDLGAVLVRWMRYLSRELARRARGADPVERLDVLLTDVRSADLVRFWNELVWARRLLVGTSNPNRRLLLDALLISWRELRHGTSH